MPFRLILGVIGAVLATSAVAAPVRKPPPAKPAPKKPAAPFKRASTSVTPATLATALKHIGYVSKPEGAFQQVKIEEEKFGYTIDLGFSKSGEWLVCMAHLAPVGDLTAVKSTPLLSLLAANDALLGMAFSYDRTNGRVMLNATVPSKGLDAPELQRVLARLQLTIHETQGLWDTSLWH